MQHDLWKLSGPAGFINEAMRIFLESGCMVAALPGGRRKSFGEALERRILETDVCGFRRLDISGFGDMGPGEAIVRGGLPTGAYLGMNFARGLAQAAELDSEALWVEGIDEPNWRAWDVFLRAYRRERSASPLVAPFMIGASVPVELASEDVGLRVLSWTGALRRIDTSLYVSEQMQRRLPAAAIPRLFEMVIVELAGWNLDLANRLLKARNDDLLNPLSWLREKASGVPKHGPSLELGTLESWDNNDFICSLALAANGDTQELDRRLWRAHLTAVFPWLEEIRLSVVEAYQEYLIRCLPSPTAWGGAVEHPQDLEFGHLLYLIEHKLPRDFREFLYRCKRMRDCLAHRKPVDGEDLREAFLFWRDRHPP